MDDLVERLKQQAGLTEEQAQKSLEVIKDYIKEQFPMFASAVDNLLQQQRGDFLP